MSTKWKILSTGLLAYITETLVFLVVLIVVSSQGVPTGTQTAPVWINIWGYVGIIGPVILASMVGIPVALVRIWKKY